MHLFVEYIYILILIMQPTNLISREQRIEKDTQRVSWEKIEDAIDAEASRLFSMVGSNKM